ncbi:hypothetical protein O3P69_004119 [Scylla paramamosain]|uniref:Gustatory receptor n=1 Tax=Scylla paramamosain TaxID=85552 RepID=A0AAW0UH25_SCYPA
MRSLRQLSSGSQDQDLNPETTAGDIGETHLGLDDIRGSPLSWCRIVGIHVIVRNHLGEYVVSGLSVTQAVAMLGISVVCLGIVGRKLFMPIPLWFFMVLFSVVCGFAFCVFAFTHTFCNARRMQRYMAAFGNVPARVGRGRTVMSGVCYPMLVSVATCLLLPEWVMALPSVLMTSAVPALLDAYMVYFSRGLRDKLQNLAREVRRRDAWTTREVSDVSLRWVAVTQLLKEHNKIFSLTLLLRLLLTLVQAMAYLIVLWATTNKILSCLPVLAVTFLPLLELILRLFHLCQSGEELARAGEGVVAGVRCAAYTQPAASAQQLDLSALAARLEAHQTRLRIWGMDSLSSSTFVTISGLVLTYLVALIQFCASERMDWVGGDQQGVFRRLNICFPEDAQNLTYRPLTESMPPLPALLR